MESSFKGNEFLTEVKANELLTDYLHLIGEAKSLKKLNIQIVSLQPIDVLKYTLETFVEKRCITTASKPYSSEFMDDGLKENEYHGDVWSVDVKPGKSFKNEISFVDLREPLWADECESCNGARLEQCEACHSNIRIKCPKCKGTGNTSAPEKILSFETPLYDQVLNRSYVNNTYNLSSVPEVKRTIYDDPFYRVECDNCAGKCFIKCNNCRNGTINCTKCESSGKLIKNFRLGVEFSTLKDEHFNKHRNFPIPFYLLSESSYLNVFFEQNIKLKPIADEKFSEFTKTSESLIDKHLHCETTTKDCRVLEQRHYIDLIPVSICKYKVNNSETFQLYIYGYKHLRIYDPYERSNKKCSLM